MILLPMFWTEGARILLGEESGEHQESLENYCQAAVKRAQRPYGDILGSSFLQLRRDESDPLVVGHNVLWHEKTKGRKHKMQIRVSQTPGYSGSDCYTGWHDSPRRKGASWVMDAREIPIRSLVHGTTQHGPADGRDSGFVAKRTLAFTKKNDDTKLEIVV